jgi:hypothetical protein
MGIAGGYGAWRLGVLPAESGPVGENFRLDGCLGSRNLPSSSLIPRWMARSAVVRDYRALEIGRRRANRLELTVTV